MIAVALYKQLPPVHRSLTIIAISLFIIPIIFSYTSIRETLNHYNLCFVGPPSTDVEHKRNKVSTAPVSPLFGTYRAFDGASYYFIKTPFDVAHTCLLPVCGWPDATTVNNIMSPYAYTQKRKHWTVNSLPSSPHVVAAQNAIGSPMLPSDNFNDDGPVFHNVDSFVRTTDLPEERLTNSIHWDQSHDVHHEGGESRWCLQSQEMMIPGTTREAERIARFCSPPVASVLADASKKPFFPELPLNPPPNTHWGQKKQVRVECFVDGHMGRLKSFEGVGSLGVVWNLSKLPGTLFLMVLHTFLFVKWKNSGIGGGESVGVYEEIMEGEIWSVVTGAFVNISDEQIIWTLWNLWIVGALMEEDYGSLTYVYLHIATVIMVGVVTIVLSTLYKKWRRCDHIDEQVCIFGYSAVIFAWIVICGMERNIFPLVPFTDIYVPIKGNTVVAPLLINALLAFLIIPKTISFDDVTLTVTSIPFSHLAGILVGVAVHYNIPPRSFLAPHLLITFIVYLQLIFLKKVICCQGSGKDYDGVAVADHGAGGALTTGPPDHNKGLKCMLHCLRFLVILCNFAGIVALDHSMAIAGSAVSILFFMGTGEYLSRGFNFRTDCILRGYFIAKTIIFISDSKSIGAWLASKLFILTNPDVMFTERDIFIYSTTRTILNFLSIVNTAQILETRDHSVDLFGSLFVHCRTVGEAWWGLFGEKQTKRPGLSTGEPPRQIMV